MGDCGQCSKFVTMQLFHELKQQFPTLPDHVVSQCIVQSNHDRETCARKLRARQDSRPPPGAFPPPAPQLDDHTAEIYLSEYPSLRLAMSDKRPNPQQQFTTIDPSKLQPLIVDIDTQSTAVQTSSQESSVSPVSTHGNRFYDGLNADQSNLASSFALNVNVNCNRVIEAQDLLTTCEPGQLSAYQPISIPTDPSTRRVTSVSLTLRPSSSEIQQQQQQQQQQHHQPVASSSIDISSQGPSSLTYSSSDPRAGGYQSHLQISITSKKRPTLPQPQTPNSLDTMMRDSKAQFSRPPMSPQRTSNLLPPRTSTTSAPTTPSRRVQSTALPSSSLPTTPLLGPSTSLGAIPRNTTSRQSSPGYPPEYQGILTDVPNELKSLVTNQLISRDRLAAVVAAEKQTLADLEREDEMMDEEISPEEQQLHSEIYHLQLECDQLAEEVDRVSGSQVPLGETNEAFYQHIYTGQNFGQSAPNRVPPPLPSQPPAWQPQSTRTEFEDEPEGPPWFCSQCTFANHPQILRCEMCCTPRLVEPREGETQDIRIRVIHHKLPPRRTLKNWVI